ncbi:MAG: Na+/H+ antiporter subunit E [Pseudomonadota bacterium]
MREFAINIVAAFAYASIDSSFTMLNVLAGFGIGFAAIVIAQGIFGGTRYLRRAIAWVKLIIMFHYELIISSFEVGVDILTPKHRARPAIINMPLDVKSDLDILLVSNLITLTPGTLSLDISEDRCTLRVHAMFADDPDALCASLKGGMERWVYDAVEAP